MTVIDVGYYPQANYTMSAGSTIIGIGNPANATGILTSFSIGCGTALTGAKMGTFYGASTSWTDRDYENIGNVSAGIQTFTGLFCSVSTNDIIGIVAASGSHYYTNTVVGIGRRSEDVFGQKTAHTFDMATFAGYKLWLYAEGADIVPPVVTAQAASNIFPTTAIGNGNITETGLSNATIRGVQWDIHTHAGGDYANDVHEHGDYSTGAFTISLTGLPEETTIYARAYATNSAGTGYSSEITFTTKNNTTANSSILVGDKVLTSLKSKGITKLYITHAEVIYSGLKTIGNVRNASVYIVDYILSQLDKESLNAYGSLTNEGYGELGKILSGEEASCVKKVCCLKNECISNESQTSSGVSMCTENGLTITNADSIKSIKTLCDNDCVQLDHIFTAGENAAVSGFGTWNDDGDVLYSLCCFGTAINLSSGDVLVVRSKIRFSKE